MPDKIVRTLWRTCCLRKPRRQPTSCTEGVGEGLRSAWYLQIVLAGKHGFRDTTGSHQSLRDGNNTLSTRNCWNKTWREKPMKQSSIQIDRENKTVTIIMPLEKPRPSKSTGKTRVIATTGGLKTSEESYARRPVCFTANVFFYPATPLNPDEDGH